MCTLIALVRPNHDWPLLVAANRDEMAGRPWKPPDRHWPDRSHVVAGLDEVAGGSWLGVNDDGMVAGVLNRIGTLGPEDGKRSRGELVLEALDHAEAQEAAKALADLDPRAYRPFNLFIGDCQNAYWLRNDGLRVAVQAVPEGLHMLTAHDMDDPRSPRINAYLPRFLNAKAPDPAQDDWKEWQSLLAEGKGEDGGNSEDASLLIRRPNGFGTVSSALIGLPKPGRNAKPAFLFAPGPPDGADFKPLALGRKPGPRFRGK